MEIFPENPYCPMGHFNTEWTMGGAGPYHMNLDLFPAVKVPEDLGTVKGIMDEVADRFGRDKDKIREVLAVQYNMAHWSFPLAAKAGCQLKELKENELDLFITAYRTFFDAYLDILRKRKDTRFNEGETRLKLERNGKWLEYITLKDRAVKMAQAIGVPVEVIISLSYPPSAVF
jgi:coproporphyrinogen III oxidase